MGRAGRQLHGGAVHTGAGSPPFWECVSEAPAAFILGLLGPGTKVSLPLPLPSLPRSPFGKFPSQTDFRLSLPQRHAWDARPRVGRPAPQLGERRGGGGGSRLQGAGMPWDGGRLSESRWGSETPRFIVLVGGVTQEFSEGTWWGTLVSGLQLLGPHQGTLGAGGVSEGFGRPGPGIILGRPVSLTSAWSTLAVTWASVGKGLPL